MEALANSEAQHRNLDDLEAMMEQAMGVLFSTIFYGQHSELREKWG